MARNFFISIILALFAIALFAACTPPPAKTGDTSGEEAATETPTNEGMPPVVTGTEGETGTSTGVSEEQSGSVIDGETVVGEGLTSTDGTTTTQGTETMTQTLPPDIFGYYETWPPASIKPEEVDLLRRIVVVMETTKGTMKIRLFPDVAPLHSANFVKLVQEGFYNGLIFHRVIDGFMSQGGDPEGTGSGGPGYTIPAEIGLPHEEGSLAAARTGDQVNPERRSSGSQFYICRSTQGCANLNGQYTVYGKVIEGLEVNRALTVNYTSAGPMPGAQSDSIVHCTLVLE